MRLSAKVVLKINGMDVDVDVRRGVEWRPERREDIAESQYFQRHLSFFQLDFNFNY
jgi:hypothetical protein